MEITGVFWVWIAVAAIFALIEIFTVTFFGLWMAIAALVPAILVFILPSFPVAGQLLVWVVASLICAWIWVRWIRSKPEPWIAEPLIGQQGILASALTPPQTSILLLSKPVQGRQEWPCISEQPLARQARVKVVAVINDDIVKVEAV
ncbi:NfeD family protein [Tatumella citrea]|uniref:Uncharacterized protein n=1 Tax=Tatumella citrea TaxID=53336 RepID=A0A1Y0LQG9_TATCI|nr:NfeD family protein [Tatumella citrea]ARU95960.1 hypothetical protein A7K98_20970 [Tatumella citrea]ARV00001.1 hypothetical protein A7K99_20955 [Tatumella citrea]